MNVSAESLYQAFMREKYPYIHVGFDKSTYKGQVRHFAIYDYNFNEVYYTDKLYDLSGDYPQNVTRNRKIYPNPKQKEIMLVRSLPELFYDLYTEFYSRGYSLPCALSSDRFNEYIAEMERYGHNRYRALCRNTTGKEYQTKRNIKPYTF